VRGSSSISGKISDAAQGFAMVFFIVGSLLYFGGHETDVYARFFLINRLFLWGCTLIFADALKTTYSAAVSTGIGLDNLLDLATTIIFLLAAILGGHYLARDTPTDYQVAMACWLIGSGLCLIGPLRALVHGVRHDAPQRSLSDLPSSQQSVPESSGISSGSEFGASDSERYPAAAHLGLLEPRQRYGGVES
jgi:hypothetical protein